MTGSFIRIDFESGIQQSPARSVCTLQDSACALEVALVAKG